MALSSYDDLVSSIQNWMYDRPDLAPMCGDFIALAEGELNQKLRTRDQIESVSLALDDGGASELPNDYLAFRHVVAINNPFNALELITPSYADAFKVSSGAPKYFTIDGSVIKVFPSSKTELEFTYFAKIPPLTQKNSTNWLLKKYPNLYLYAACIQAGIFVGDEGRTVAMASKLQSDLDAFQAAEEVSLYSRAAMRISGPTP